MQTHLTNMFKNKTVSVCVGERKVLLVYICSYLKHAIKVFHFQVWRKLKLVADVITTFASIRYVDCQHQGLVAECLHSVHELL